ncbi:glycosyltransferase [Streptomyces sp. NPDC054796]
MRYLFTTIPGTSHMLPLVPLAHAALAAGHEVLVASSGPALRVAASAGLHAVPTDDGRSAGPYEELGRVMGGTSKGKDLPDSELVTYFGSVFARIGELMLDGLVEAAADWRADAVVYPPPHPAGLLAARAAGVPAVLHNLGIRRPTFGPAVAAMAEAAERRGIEGAREADIQVDLSAPSLENFVQGPVQHNTVPHTVAMNYSPYNGGGELPLALLRRGSRPRVAVTLGSLPATYGEGTQLRDVVLGTAELGVDLVVATGGAELPALPDPLPPHVTLVDWVPLRALLGSCDALVHHGGLGTMYAAFHAGVPQLAVPAPGTDAGPNAAVPVARGAGLRLDLAEVTADAVAERVGKLLDEPEYRKASEEVAVEMREMPTPGGAVDALTRLCGEVSA